MGKFFVVVGTTGVGKTTLTSLLCQATGFSAGLEQHEERPYQKIFLTERKYAIHNQMDYLLFRIEQEIAIRGSGTHGILDGGLEMDFFGFTRLFHAHGWLSDADHELCRKIYHLARTYLPPPDGIIYISASPQVTRKRLEMRQRINIADADDSAVLDEYIVDWLSAIDNRNIMKVDSTNLEPSYKQVLPELVSFIYERVNIEGKG